VPTAAPKPAGTVTPLACVRHQTDDGSLGVLVTVEVVLEDQNLTMDTFVAVDPDRISGASEDADILDSALQRLAPRIAALVRQGRRPKHGWLNTPINLDIKE